MEKKENKMSLLTKVKYAIIILLLILLAIFIGQNLHQVTVNLFSFSGKLALSLLLLAIAVFGYIISRLTNVFMMNKKSKEIKLLKKEIERIKQLNKKEEV